MIFAAFLGMDAQKCFRKNSDSPLSDRTEQQRDRAQENGCVLLLDEIDKADSELPNSLLEVLANNGFRLPWESDNEIKPDKSKDASKPLIMITTNEDRELPPAFVRRCLVITIEPGSNFTDWIKDRARTHFRNPKTDSDDGRPAMADEILDEAARLLDDDREKLRSESHLPGLPEYLDLLRGLYHLAPNNEAEQKQWLGRVAGFAYNKRAQLNR